MSESLAGPASTARAEKWLGPKSFSEAIFSRWWPEPGPARRRATLAAISAGVIAALLIPGAPGPGIDLVLSGLCIAVPVAVLARAHGRAAGRRRPLGRVRVLLGLVVLGLAAVAGVRAGEGMAWFCGFAAICLAAAIVLDARRWSAILAAPALFALAAVRSLPWAARSLPTADLRVTGRPWLTGLGIGTICTIVVASLLASADAAFADVVAVAWPSVDLSLVPARALTFVTATGTGLGAMFAVSTRTIRPPRVPSPAVRPGGVGTEGRPEQVRHPAEWLVPLALVAATIAAFLSVEVTMLFGGAEVVHREGSVSHADRAREGFGQLTVVTLIVLGLLAWAGHRAGRGPALHRRLLGSVGGPLLLLTLLLAGSALRRLWLYQDAYGWTVTRLNAGVFEVWVAAVLAGIALGWLLRRTDLLPRFVIGSAGLGLLLVGMAGPDAVVARADVSRYEHTHRIDISYLSMLSADAVPALDRLPEPLRSCALAGRTTSKDPWFGWNRGRARADAVLTARPPGTCGAVPESADG
jgi:hypothetical protein